jgi:hypothetical protein
MASLGQKVEDLSLTAQLGVRSSSDAVQKNAQVFTDSL